MRTEVAVNAPSPSIFSDRSYGNQLDQRRAGLKQSARNLGRCPSEGPAHGRAGAIGYRGQMTPPPPTHRFQFREMMQSDLDNMAALLGDPDVMRFYTAPKSRQEAATWIQWNQANYAEHGYGLWIIETLDGEFAGDCGLTWQQVNGSPKLEVGYHVRVQLHGHGYATEAAMACRDFAREHTDATELVAIIHPDNRASERVAEKIGMHRAAGDHGGTIPVLSMRL